MLTELSAVELAAKLRSREVSATEVAQAQLNRIAELDANLGAFLHVSPENVLEEAANAQKLLDSGEGGALTGVPIALKDNMCTLGLPTTCASKILENYIPPYDATVVGRLREQGLVLLGKTNMDEFAMGGSTEKSAYRSCHNPWDLTCAPGGSSGGSAVAVAGSLAPLSLGSDTGGSIRQPASLCGIVGFKPTYGRVSRYGLVAFSSSLDQIGPFGRSVEDVAAISDVISGYDHHDSTSLPNAGMDNSGLKDGTLKGKRFALPKELFGSGIEPGVLSVIHETIDLLKKEGVEFTEVSVPSIAQAVTIYYIIAPAEASSNLARFDGVRYGPRIEGDGHIGSAAKTRGELFGHEVKARIMIGTYALSAGYFDAYYLRAQQVRAVMAQDFEKIFAEFDAVFSPTSPAVAFKLGALDSDPMALKMLDLCTIPANMGGFPAISLNAGLSGGLPVGLQLMGPVMGDENLLQLAYSVERAMPAATVRPRL
ncbi:MAG: Asp-tRNA(Asn)/Glu-tRNA(Gln) amidotransferase subunit GatA [Armatimonadetes bacterium]|nr:Asp-tRNA(Asn)/Glu-tRNA(Gln) amidotransferase subunit GatA [Armatimonadota bacterium]